jgi:hypothetical protein
MGYLYFFDHKPHHRAVNLRLTRDGARRIAVNFARLPGWGVCADALAASSETRQQCL